LCRHLLLQLQYATFYNGDSAIPQSTYPVPSHPIADNEHCELELNYGAAELRLGPFPNSYCCGLQMKIISFFLGSAASAGNVFANPTLSRLEFLIDSLLNVPYVPYIVISTVTQHLAGLEY
jgi:hypothetical protein